MKSPLSDADKKMISRLLLNDNGKISFRIDGTAFEGRVWADVNQLIDFLTDLIETCIEDNKQEAYKGLRIILRAVRQNVLNDVN